MIWSERRTELKKKLLPIHKRLKITTLSHWEWADRDNMILHASFQVLVDFIDRECSPGVVNWDYDEQHRDARAELQRLYDWWKARPDRQEEDCPSFPWSDFEKPEEERSEAYKLAKPIMDRNNALEETWRQDDERNLIALVKIRPYMWT